MLGKITIMAARQAIATHDALTDRVGDVCSLVKKHVPWRGSKDYKDGKRCPLDSISAYCAAHGNIYPDHGWSIDNDENIHVSAWDGYDGENFDNAEFVFPFKWLNESDENIVKMVKEGV